MPLAIRRKVVWRPPDWNNTNNKIPHQPIVRRRTLCAAIGTRAAVAALRSHPHNPQCGT